MSILFKVEGKVVVPTTETLMTEPFKTIWERDESEHKGVAMTEFAYIEFMESHLKSNPFAGYDREKRHSAILENKKLPEDWKPDEEVCGGMGWMKTFQTEGSLTFSYYESVRKGAKKLKHFFNTFDMNERNPKSFMPMWKPAEITRSMKDTEEVLTNLDKIKKRVEKELFETTKRRADKEISVFAKRPN